jgi:hypothetical protein
MNWSLPCTCPVTRLPDYGAAFVLKKTGLKRQVIYNHERTDEPPPHCPT